MNLHKTNRPREKMQRMGPAALKDEELIAILLRTGVQGKDVIALSKEILQDYPPAKLMEVSLEELRSKKGLGLAKASILLAAFELTKRFLGTMSNDAPTIQTPRDILAHVQEIREKKKEHFVALYLNARNHLICKEFVSIGTINSSLVHPREVFAPAIQHASTNVILVHNHPSGDCQPSKEDLEITQQLVSAGQLLGIEILDHLIVSDSAYLSLKEENLL